MEQNMKTAEEIAKTTNKALELVLNFAKFISKHVDGSLEQTMGMFEDKLKYMRWERQVRLMQKADEFRIKFCIKDEYKQIPMKLAIPFFEASTLEDDDYLQDLWAKLLVNSTNPENDFNLTRSIISILEQMTSLDAIILEKIYENSYEEMFNKGVKTGYLPEYAPIQIKEDDDDIKLNDIQIKLALSNLSRIGCLKFCLTWSGEEHFDVVIPTLLGKTVYEACTLKNYLV
ncbi:Abi-alpha family protein [Fusibacter tunisiensis]|uniref:DUF4393 domain-containing protein n=1 Tax=Fusibacter tunisiensis TaxID=1008308 RepID=A0ABS2MTP5_9FIRM|nr:Abi-alpha family protein [Fusibacter tunisiensis]MBM7562769.1 hypothetical protein [Fusibacter tunisiensis]